MNIFLALPQNVLFAFQLEEGEIDVRFNSFKGCILKKVLWRTQVITQVSMADLHMTTKGYLW